MKWQKPKWKNPQKKYIYEVHSELAFDSGRDKHERTYYGSDYPVSENFILEKAKANIMNKFEKSGGRIINLKIARSWKK